MANLISKEQFLRQLKAGAAYEKAKFLDDTENSGSEDEHEAESEAECVPKKTTRVAGAKGERKSNCKATAHPKANCKAKIPSANVAQPKNQPEEDIRDEPVRANYIRPYEFNSLFF
jgi:hypothetical protein